MNFTKIRQKLAVHPIREIQFQTVTDSKIVEFDISSLIESQTVAENIRTVQKELPISLENYCNTNVKAWHSDYYTHLFTDKFNDLIEVIQTTCLNLFTVIPNHGKVDLKVVELWTIIYKENDHTRLHRHTDSFNSMQLSVVYFAHADEDATPLVFYKDRGSEYKIEIIPKTGHLVCFPASMMHSVPTIKPGETRICVSANLNFSITELNVESIKDRNPNLKEKHEAS